MKPEDLAGMLLPPLELIELQDPVVRPGLMELARRRMLDGRIRTAQPVERHVSLLAPLRILQTLPDRIDHSQCIPNQRQLYDRKLCTIRSSTSSTFFASNGHVSFCLRLRLKLTGPGPEPEPEPITAGGNLVLSSSKLRWHTARGPCSPINPANALEAGSVVACCCRSRSKALRYPTR